jgi:L-arabinose isomerase
VLGVKNKTNNNKKQVFTKGHQLLIEQKTVAREIAQWMEEACSFQNFVP